MARIPVGPSVLERAQGLLEKADLCVFDSDWEIRFEEVRLWNECAKPDAVAIIHDTANQPDTIHASLRDLIWELDMNGVFLKNPRGCFMAVQGKDNSAGEA